MVAQKESLVIVQVGDMMIPMSGTEAEKWHEHLKELEAKKNLTKNQKKKNNGLLYGKRGLN